MERIQLTDANIRSCAKVAAEVLNASGTILYPTDTLYGLGADAFSDDAVGKIYDIKGRDNRKPVHAIVSSIDMAAEYGELSHSARELIAALPRGQVTFVVQKKEGVHTGIAKNIRTFGFRIPDNEFCMAMLEVFGAPITATSANISGKVTGLSADDILSQFGSTAVRIDVVLDAGSLPKRDASTVIDLSEDNPVVLRKGAVPENVLLPLLEEFGGAR